MSKTYESLEPQGHFNFAKRVFQKIKGYIDSKSTSMTLDNYNALTPAQKNDGTIRFIPASSSSGTSTAFDMSGITSYKEYNMSIAATSSTETNVSWDGGNAIGCNWNYTTQIDVTNISAITFTVTNGSCYGGGAQAQQTRWDVQIGLMATPPTSVINVLPSDSSWAAVADMPLSNHTYEETLDVSGLSGNYYIVCFAHGWNTTVEDIAFRSGEGYSSQIKYMSETYGNNINDVMVNGVSVIDTNKIAQITETDQNVTQTQDDSTNNNFEILLAGSTSTSTATEGAKKTSGFVFNPSQQAITIGTRKANSTIGSGSFASGYNIEASQRYTHAEGNSTKASGIYAHAEGGGTIASGQYTHAEGSSTTASGLYAHAEGFSTIASSSYSHAEGSSTKASNTSAHAEGSGTTASGTSAHAEGSSTTASGFDAHAEGGGTTASNTNAHAEGRGTEASGYNAHAEGDSTIANHKSQHVFGEYNIADPSSATASDRGNYVEIVGNGTSLSARSNARTLDWDGNEVLSGKLTVGTAPTNNMDVTTKQYVDTGLASADEIIEITATDYDALSYAEKHNGKYYHITDRNSSNELDTKVTQTQDDSTNATYEVLLAGSTSATTATESAKKSSGLTYNPSTSVLSMSGTPSGNTDVVTKAYADGKVDKTGDTMTGDLNINSNNAKTKYINPNMTLDTSANNGLSSDSGYGAYFTDKNGNAVGDISMTTRSTGANYVQLMARNKKTDGTAVANYIDVIAAKDGSSSYYVSNPTAFKTALDLGFLKYKEHISMNAQTNKSTTLTDYGDACYVLIGFIPINATNRGFLMVLFNVKNSVVNQINVVNTHGFSNLTLNSNGSLNINFNTSRYAELDIYQTSKNF